MKRWKVIFLCICAFWAGACSVTRSLKDGEYLLRKNQVKVDDPSFDAASLMSYIAQKPNSYLLGVNPLLSVYNWGGDGKTKMGRFVQSVGVAPVVYDPALVEKSINSIGNHLHYIGYYGSQVESQVQVKGRKVYVSYYVALGKRYTISAIDYVLPEYGTIKQEFMEDLPHSTVAVGDFLAEEDLEKEAERSALMFRNKGYYGLTKSYYLFDADTLAHDGTAKLTYNLRDYALGDPVSTAKPHQKFTLGKVNISHPEKLKIRRRTLENMNTLRPGQLYSEQEVNTTYTRLANLGMLSGVNVRIQPTSDKTVDADITLRNSRLQAIKADLEGSFNSTGLFGISPQINYYHKNIFHGGERLNVGVKGNFQFKPGRMPIPRKWVSPPPSVSRSSWACPTAYSKAPTSPQRMFPWPLPTRIGRNSAAPSSPLHLRITDAWDKTSFTSFRCSASTLPGCSISSRISWPRSSRPIPSS